MRCVLLLKVKSVLNVVPVITGRLFLMYKIPFQSVALKMQNGRIRCREDRNFFFTLIFGHIFTVCRELEEIVVYQLFVCHSRE